MHDFNCTRADDMNFKLIADRTRYLKENPKGVSEMCRILEEMKEESLQEGMKQGMEQGIQEEKRMTVLRMLKSGKYQLEEIAAVSGLSLDEVKRLKEERVS